MRGSEPMTDSLMEDSELELHTQALIDVLQMLDTDERVQALNTIRTSLQSAR